MADITKKLAFKDIQFGFLASNVDLMAWWDMSQLPTMNDGAEIDIVDDLSGNGNYLNNFTAGAGLRPTKQTVDGKSVARFSTTSRLFCTPMASVGAPLTIIVVAKFNVSQNVGSNVSLFVTNTGSNQFGFLINNAASEGTPYYVGNAVTAESDVGISVLDGSYHVLTLSLGTASSKLFVDGIMTQRVVSGDALGGFLNSPYFGSNASTSFQGDLAEAVILRGSANADTVNKVKDFMSAKWGIDTLPDNLANGVPNIYKSGTDAAGNTYRIYKPANPAPDAPLVIWSHPQAHNEQIGTTYFAWPYAYACMSLGWYFCASSLGNAGTPGGSSSSWGNQSAQTAMLNLYNIAALERTFNNVILMGASMGGLNSIQTFMKNTVPNVKGIYIIDAAISLLEMYKTAAYSGTVDLGYSISAGTLSAAASAGAASISSSVSFPAGTSIIIDPLGANPEIKVTGTPSGAGPYTIPLTTNLAYAHSSAVKVSDYPSKTNGWDPIMGSVASFAGLPVRFTSSPGDTTTVQSLHTLPFQALIASIAEESANINHAGGHLSRTSVRVRDFIDFVRRSIQ